MGFTLEFCVRSISSETFERFSFNFTQMFLSVRQRGECMTWLQRLKVLQVNGIYPLISCQLHLCWTLWMVFKKLHPNVPCSVKVRIAHDSDMQTPGQGQTSRSWDFAAGYLAVLQTVVFFNLCWCMKAANNVDHIHCCYELFFIKHQLLQFCCSSLSLY